MTKLSRMSNSKGELQDEIVEKSSAEMAWWVALVWERILDTLV